MGTPVVAWQTALRLMPAAVCIGIVSLSVHVVMLQLLHVPYPDMAGVGRSGMVLVVLRTLALMIVYRLSRPSIAEMSVASRVVLVALLDTMIAGNVRSAIMDAVVTTSAAFPAINLLMQVAKSLILASLVVGSQRIARHPAAMVGAAVAVTALTTFLVAPVIRNMVSRFAELAGTDVYTEPYGLYVLSWSYATFLEIVAAAFVIAALIGSRLTRRHLLALVQFTTLVLLLRGTLVMQLLFPWLMKGGPVPSALSTSQFFLQDLVMAVLVWLAWRARYRTGAVALA